MVELIGGEYRCSGQDAKLLSRWIPEIGQRLAALELFEQARAQGLRAMKPVEAWGEVLLANMARRAGEFDRALGLCDAGLALTIDSIHVGSGSAQAET
jgi:hypothetical protein